MIKKKILAIILCFIIVSCGKKNDPIYEDSEKKVKIQSVLISKA